MLSRSLFFFLFFSSLLFAPLSAQAALIPCGRVSDDPQTSINEQAPCTLCHVVIGGQGLISWGLKLMTTLAIAIIVAMGLLYILSGGNDSLMQTAKRGIFASLIGFALMLGAFLIVNTALRLLSAEIPGLAVSEGGFSFSCTPASSANTGSGQAPVPPFASHGTQEASPIPSDPRGLPPKQPSLEVLTLSLSKEEAKRGETLTLTLAPAKDSFNLNRGALSLNIGQGLSASTLSPASLDPITLAIAADAPYGDYPITILQNGTALGSAWLRVAKAGEEGQNSQPPESVPSKGDTYTWGAMTHYNQGGSLSGCSTAYHSYCTGYIRCQSGTNNMEGTSFPGFVTFEGKEYPAEVICGEADRRGQPIIRNGGDEEAPLGKFGNMFELRFYASMVTGKNGKMTAWRMKTPKEPQKGAQIELQYGFDGSAPEGGKYYFSISRNPGEIDLAKPNSPDYCTFHPDGVETRYSSLAFFAINDDPIQSSIPCVLRQDTVYYYNILSTNSQDNFDPQRINGALIYSNGTK